MWAVLLTRLSAAEAKGGVVFIHRTISSDFWEHLTLNPSCLSDSTDSKRINWKAINCHSDQSSHFSQILIYIILSYNFFFFLSSDHLKLRSGLKSSASYVAEWCGLKSKAASLMQLETSFWSNNPSKGVRVISAESRSRASDAEGVGTFRKTFGCFPWGAETCPAGEKTTITDRQVFKFRMFRLEGDPLF